MQKRQKELLIYAATIIFSILFIVVGHRLVCGDIRLFDTGLDVVSAKIERIVDYYAAEADMTSAEPVETLRITFDAVITSGPAKGESIRGIQTADSFTPIELRHAEEGDRVLLYEMEEVDEESPERWVLQEFVRTGPIYALFAIFALSLVLFGGLKGVSTLISLIFTCLAIFAVFIPSVLANGNIYLTSLIVCVYTIVVTLLLVNGANSKSLAAGLGCVGGVTVCGLLVLVANVSLKLTGLISEESVFLLYLNPGSPIDLGAVIFSAIIIGALGATLDVSVSIASALHEIREVSARPTFASLVKSGMTIGRDIMGTMANTLVLAYIGSSLSMVLLLLVNSASLTDLLNREIIVVEGLQAIVGSLGLLFTIPLTSLLSAYIYTRKTPLG